MSSACFTCTVGSSVPWAISTGARIRAAFCAGEVRWSCSRSPRVSPTVGRFASWKRYHSSSFSMVIRSVTPARLAPAAKSPGSRASAVSAA
jgi:hypothetical protein